jgi:hypothetical protein
MAVEEVSIEESDQSLQSIDATNSATEHDLEYNAESEVDMCLNSLKSVIVEEVINDIITTVENLAIFHEIELLENDTDVQIGQESVPIVVEKVNIDQEITPIDPKEIHDDASSQTTEDSNKMITATTNLLDESLMKCENQLSAMSQVKGVDCGTDSIESLEENIPTDDCSLSESAAVETLDTEKLNSIDEYSLTQQPEIPDNSTMVPDVAVDSTSIVVHSTVTPEVENEISNSIADSERERHDDIFANQVTCTPIELILAAPISNEVS